MAFMAMSHVWDTVQEYATEQQKARNQYLLRLLKCHRLSPVSKPYPLVRGWKQTLHEVIELPTHMVVES